jgi:hypothetical protein
MQITKRRATVIAAALVLGGACVASQPAIAKDPTGSIDSREILNKTIRGKDLKPGLLAKINLAVTALQEIPDGSITTQKLADDAVTTQKLADDAVTGPKLADNSVGASEIGPNAINSEELANDSVDTGAVANGSLTALDIAAVRGVANLNYASIPAHSCLSLQVNTGQVLNNDLILATPGPTMPGIITVNARQGNIDSTNIAFVACNGAAVALDPGLVPIAWAVIEN